MAEKQLILIVDDEPDICESLSDLFQAVLTVDCITATSGELGLKQLESNRVDLIISDYKMPGMGGLAFLQEAQRLAPNVPRALMTAYPDVEVATRAINEASISTFFSKPLDPENIIEAVRRMLHLRRAKGARDQAISRAMDLIRKGGK